MVENYFSRQGQPLVDVVVNTLMFAQTMATPTFSRVEEKDLYLRLGVPLIKAILSVANGKTASRVSARWTWL